MDEVALVFPHQLFDHHPAFSDNRSIFLVEDRSFFLGANGQFKFHKKKLMLHRATVQIYRDRLLSQGYIVHYLPFQQDLLAALKHENVSRIYVADPVDHILESRILAAAEKLKMELNMLESPGFLTPVDWIREFFRCETHLSQTKFYIAQRKRLKILLTEDSRPIGGKWSFDAENPKETSQ